MSSVQLQPELINEQLTPDEETFTEVKEIIVKSEEDMNDQSRPSGFIRTPRVILCRIDHLSDHVWKEEDLSDSQLCKQESDSNLDRKKTEPLQVKEEQQEPEHSWIKEELSELCIGEREDQVVLKQETEDTFMVTPTVVEKCHFKPEPIKIEVFSQDPNETENQDEEGNHHRDSVSMQEKCPKQNKQCQKTTKRNNSKPIRKKKTRTDHSCKTCGDFSSEHNHLSDHVWKEEVLNQQFCKQERDSSLDSKEPEPLQMKEEQQEPEHSGLKEEVLEMCIGEQEEQSVLKQETEDTFMVTPTVVEKFQVTPEPIRNHVISQDSNKTKNQDEEGNNNKDSGSKHNKWQKLNKRRQKTTKRNNSEPKRKTKTQTEYSCKICGNLFSDNCKKLILHLKSHTREKRFKCSSCGKSFTKISDLDRHVTTHTGDKPFSCTICGKGLISKFNLSRHMRLHTGEKPFPCIICHKVFTQKFDLSRHMRLHTGEKRFTCLSCGKSFTAKSSLDNHVRIHTGERPFSCTICRKDFTQSSHLTGHMWVHRGETLFTV